MKHQHIHVKRYSDPKAVGGWEGTVEPADRSWIVFIPVEGDALFYRRVEFCTGDDIGTVEHGYADVELPGGMPLQHLQTPELPEPKRIWPGPIDFEVTPLSDEGLEDLPPEAQQFNPSKQNPGFWARLNCREVMCWGPTEHEAVRNLMNYAVQLAVAGCLDHTGQPMRHHNKRRYNIVFPPTP